MHLISISHSSTSPWNKINQVLIYSPCLFFLLLSLLTCLLLQRHHLHYFCSSLANVSQHQLFALQHFPTPMSNMIGRILSIWNPCLQKKNVSCGMYGHHHYFIAQLSLSFSRDTARNYSQNKLLPRVVDAFRNESKIMKKMSTDHTGLMICNLILEFDR